MFHRIKWSFALKLCLKIKNSNFKVAFLIKNELILKCSMEPSISHYLQSQNKFPLHSNLIVGIFYAAHTFFYPLITSNIIWDNFCTELLEGCGGGGKMILNISEQQIKTNCMIMIAQKIDITYPPFCTTKKFTVLRCSFFVCGIIKRLFCVLKIVLL